MNVEKNWLEEMVKSSDFEYFDGNEYLEVVAGEGKATPVGQDIVAGQGKATPAGQDIVAGQGKGGGMFLQASPVVSKGVSLQASPVVVARPGKAIPLQASPNPFTQYQQYNTVSNLFFDLVVKTTVFEKPGGGYPSDATYEVPILYPFANKGQGYENTLTNYGLLLKGSVVQYEEGSRFLLNNTLPPAARGGIK